MISPYELGVALPVIQGELMSLWTLADADYRDAERGVRQAEAALLEAQARLTDAHERFRLVERLCTRIGDDV
jgi:hypothetical protein